MSQLNDLAQPYTRFVAEPYTPTIGAVIHGLDLASRWTKPRRPSCATPWPHTKSSSFAAST